MHFPKRQGTRVTNCSNCGALARLATVLTTMPH
jgi:hypothetical protein